MKIIVSCGPSNLPYIQALAKQVVNYLSALKMQIIYLQYTRIFNPESVKQATANMSTTEPKPSPMAS